MVKIIRKPAKNVNFGLPKAERSDFFMEKENTEKKENEIKKKFLEIKSSEKLIRKMQSKAETENILQKEKNLKEKNTELRNMVSLWADLNKINFNDMPREEIIKIINSQKGFITDLFEHYIWEIKNEKQYIQKIKELESKK